MRKIITAAVSLLVIAVVHISGQAQSTAETQTVRPRLVVNIVVSGVPHDMLERFRGGFSSEGFVRFATEGTNFSAARFNYMQTLSPTGLATITTGVNPSMHGVVAGAWVDYVTGNRVTLADDGLVRLRIP